ncbi:MAG TPA: MFS transporter [Burkholderiales bacterium]|nr:MFS transporter [Burkholderiales bacterium]
MGPGQARETRSLSGPPPLGLAFTVWGLAAALYLAGFYQRVAPAVITRELMGDFALGAAALGNLAAVYYYSYVAMQIPAGVMADRWGPRRVLTAGAALAALGTLLFASAGSYALAGFGRLLIGASVGVAFVAMLKIAGHWFAPSRYAMLSGLALCTGVLGAVSAGVPLRLLVDAFGWRGVLAISGALTAVLAAVIWLVVRDDPSERGYESYSHALPGSHAGFSVLGGIRHALAARNVWLVFVISGGVSGPPLTFAGLWGVPFLVTHYGLSTPQAASLTSLLLASWALAGPVLGALSDRMRRRKPIYVLGTALAAAGWCVVFLVPGLPLALLVALLVAIGIVSACVMVGFAIAKESAPSSLAGTATGVANMGNMLGGMIMPPLVGWVLDRNWSGALTDGARVYDFAAYRAGFSPMLAWLAISLLLLAFTRETHCRQAQ